MSILRRSTPNSSHQKVVLVAVDYPIIHCYSGIRWLVTDYVDFCQLNLLKNSEIHWFQFIMNSSSHHTAMNYGSRSALYSRNGYCFPKTVYQECVLCNIPSSSFFPWPWLSFVPDGEGKRRSTC